MTALPEAYILTGAPGAGKTTLARRIKQATGGVLLDLSAVRQAHLPDDWAGANPIEEAFAFGLLLKTAKNYLRRPLGPVILDDLQDLQAMFAMAVLGRRRRVQLVSLVAADQEIAARLERREGGYRDVEQAVLRNRLISTRLLIDDCEIRLDTSGDAENLTAALTSLGLSVAGGVA